MHLPSLRVLAAVTLLPLLAACAGLAPVAPPRPAAAEALPEVTLSDDILYDVLLGEIASQRGQIGVTALTLGRVAQKTRDPRLAERATLAALYARQYGEAQKSAQLWVELRPEDVEAREALATVLLELDRPAEARTHLETMLAIEAGRRNLDQAYPRIAAALSRQANKPGTLELMQALVARQPRNATAHFALAHLAVRAGDLARAGAAAERALALRPRMGRGGAIPRAYSGLAKGHGARTGVLRIVSAR